MQALQDQQGGHGQGGAGLCTGCPHSEVLQPGQGLQSSPQSAWSFDEGRAGWMILAAQVTAGVCIGRR